jgi:biopolymer transport protein ExbB
LNLREPRPSQLVLMFTEAYEFLARGGPLMVPIFVSSLVGLTVFLERLWSLQRHRVLPHHFMTVVEPYLRERKWVEVRRLCDASTSGFAQILRSGLRHAGQPRGVVKEGMEEAGRRVHGQLSRYLSGLSAVVSVAPLLGLLGTVTGMISVFQRVQDTVRETGAVDPGSLGGGIWEALMTTAAGLIVAIPALICLRYLEGRIDRFMNELEERADIAADYMSAEGMSVSSPALEERPPAAAPDRTEGVVPA